MCIMNFKNTFKASKFWASNVGLRKEIILSSANFIGNLVNMY